jgi:hypothetical protein
MERDEAQIPLVGASRFIVHKYPLGRPNQTHESYSHQDATVPNFSFHDPNLGRRNGCFD